MTWMSTAVVSGSFCDVQSWWLIISTVLVCVSSLAAIRPNGWPLGLCCGLWGMLDLCHSIWPIVHVLGIRILCHGGVVSNIE